MAEHEPVELGLGQLERTALLDRVLGGDHQERRRELEGLVADGHATLLHGFQQGALHLGCGAVDLVGQQQVREDRPLVDAEFVGPLVEDLRADDVRGEQVDGELDPGELEVDRLRERRDQEGLGQARHALEQQVPAGEQRDQESLDDHVLADDDRPHALAHLPDEFECFGGDRPGPALQTVLVFEDAHGDVAQSNTGRDVVERPAPADSRTSREARGAWDTRSKPS